MANVVLRAAAKRKENTKLSGKAIYFIAEFSYQPAEEEATRVLQSFAQDTWLYRLETLSGNAQEHVNHLFRYPEHVLQERQLLEEPEA